MGMSFDAVEWAFDRPVKDSGAKLVLLTLARHADAEGYCWPSMKRISKITGLSISTIKRKIRILEDAGLVDHRRRKKADGEPDSNLYCLGVGVTVTLPMGQGEPLISNLISHNNISLLKGQDEPYPVEDEENWKEIIKRR